ncbi:hypothetical protein PHMEG_00028940 [Phytophthora megakarya]|uniref:Uncharacterized protein n=1 Tax=Phytophthora megakarya TaxID=4795 RepID=A0A225V3R8_9STRA|nr:hypothetical protein PHMEG_00028940 [Phytophthora megakarya]
MMVRTWRLVERKQQKKVSKQKLDPVAQLPTAFKAIASSLGAHSAAEDQLRALTSALQQQHQDTRRFQEIQLQILRGLLAQRQNGGVIHCIVINC